MAKKTAKPAAPTVDRRPLRPRRPPLRAAQGGAGRAAPADREHARASRQRANCRRTARSPKSSSRRPTTAVIRFTERSAQDLFDDLYAAEPVEVGARRSDDRAGRPRSGRIVEPEAQGRTSRSVVRLRRGPAHGSFPAQLHRGGQGALAQTLARHDLRRPPQQADDPAGVQEPRRETTAQPRRGADAWKRCSSGEKAEAKGTRRQPKLAGSLMLAVQAVTAEAVPFEDRVETQLLLHFWALTARIFVPQTIDEPTGRASSSATPWLSPRSADLGKFCKRYKRWLERLRLASGTSTGRRARSSPCPSKDRWNSSTISTAWPPRRSLTERPANYLAGIEFFHMVVAGQQRQAPGATAASRSTSD